MISKYFRSENYDRPTELIPAGLLTDELVVAAVVASLT